jgi:hypothetical protein
MTNSDSSSRANRRARTALLLLTAIAAAVVLNAVVAMIAIAAGAPSDYGPLTFPAFTLFTVVGILAGWAGWALLQRRARNPHRTLSVLIPVVLVLSFVPDLLLLAFRFIPGTTPGAAVALMVMHLVVAGVAVPAYALISRSVATPRTARAAGAPA